LPYDVSAVFLLIFLQKRWSFRNHEKDRLQRNLIFDNFIQIYKGIVYLQVALDRCDQKASICCRPRAPCKWHNFLYNIKRGTLATALERTLNLHKIHDANIAAQMATLETRKIMTFNKITTQMATLETREIMTFNNK
jgi:hypothetical protein